MLFHLASLALEARWTPAADGGPARFSKRYRDKQGIDDSRWTDEGSSAFVVRLLMETLEGCALAALALCALFALFYACQAAAGTGGKALGCGGASAVRQREAVEASEAARQAFLAKYAPKRE